MCGIQHSVVPLAMTLPSLIFLPTFSLVPGLIGNWLPLAKPAEEQRDVGTGCIFMAFVMGISAIIGGLSWYTWSKGWFVPFIVIEAVVMYGANHLLMHLIQRKVWLPDEE
jgi:predicted MFS family arabinose efflux permease